MIGTYQGSSPAHRVAMERFYSDGPLSTDYNTLNVNTDFSAEFLATPDGAVRQIPFFVILYDYYSPSLPQGDTRYLRALALAPTGTAIGLPNGQWKVAKSESSKVILLSTAK